MDDKDTHSNHRILIQPDIAYEEVISKAAVILYASTHQQQASQIIGKELSSSSSIQIVRNQQQQYWITKCCNKQQRQEMDLIERLIGLTLTIICIQISNSLQSIVQKSFSLLLSSIQANHPIKLIFAKSIYQNKPHTIEIKYCETASQAHTILSNHHILNTRPIQILHLIQIFDCQMPENVPKVRQAYQNYEALKQKQEWIRQLSRQIFEGSKQKGYVLQSLQKLQCSKSLKNKLLWKLQRLNKYKEWLQEQKINDRVDYSQLTFKDMTAKINQASITKYGSKWRSNSFAYLKQCFNKINNRNDTNSIKLLIAEYQAMRDNLCSIEQELADLPIGFALTEMRQQLASFYQYHQKLIEGSTLAFVPYIKAELAYLWKYNNRSYKKLAAFLILVGLAYTQDNFIRAVTILLISMIVLALKC